MSISERLAESLLSNPRADRVKAVAGLARRSARSKHGLFLAEGPQNVREALVAHVAGGAAPGSGSGDGSDPEVTPARCGELLPRLDALYLTESCLERNPDITKMVGAVLDGAGAHRVFIRLVTDEVLKVMSDAQSPQGALAVCTIPVVGLDDLWGTHETSHIEPSPQNGADDAGALGQVFAQPRLVAGLCRVQDPGNAGTIIRAADAAGADAVVLTAGSVDLFNPKTVRSTAGSLFHLPVVANADFDAMLQAATASGVQVLAADGYAALDLDELQDAAVTAPLAAAGAQETAALETTAPETEAMPLLSACDLRRPTVWLFGNEAQGLSEQEKATASHRVAVPLYGRAESLNVGTAATLCLYASARAQRRSSRAPASS